MYVGQLTVYHMLSGVRRSQNTYSAEKLHHLEDQNHGRQSGWKKKNYLDIPAGLLHTTISHLWQNTYFQDQNNGPCNAELDKRFEVNIIFL